MMNDGKENYGTMIRKNYNANIIDDYKKILRMMIKIKYKNDPIA